MIFQHSRQRRQLLNPTIAALAVLLGSSPALPQEDKSLSVNDLSWIVGTWDGLGPNDYSGAEQTIAIWTEPVEGVMSWTFRYHTPENGHVHFAFTVIEDTADGVILRGIHHARDFGHYEDTNWTYRMTAASATQVVFECVESCRGAKSLSFELTDDGLMLEKYELIDKARQPSTFRYRRLP